MATENPKKVRLSFTSKSKKINSSLNLRQQSIWKHRDNESVITQAVTNISDNLSNHNKDKKEKRKIIPLIKENKWRKPSSKPPPLEQDPNDNNKSLTNEQKEAINIISNSLNDNKINNNEICGINRIILAPNSSGALNQMQLNQAPGINDIIDVKKRIQIDIAQRPKEPNNNEYNAMPIFNYGEALLRGMGWNNNIPIGNQYGKNKNQLKIPKQIEIKSRPKNLGLGALLSKDEAKQLIERKFDPKKQRTQSDNKRIRDIQSYTESQPKNQTQTQSQPDRKKRKIEYEKIKWVTNGLKVKCIKQNKYFKQKGIINDIIDEYRFEMLMDNDSVLLRLYECDIQTVIPKKGKLVMILNGKHRKETGCILNKNKYEQYAMVQLQNDLSILKCYYDDICAI